MTDRDHPPAEQLSPAAEGDEKQRVGAVFWVTIAITAAFVAWGAFALTSFTAVLGAVVGFITTNLGWAYMLITSFFLVFVIYLACSRYGDIKLGAPDDKP
jgi:glycine betaine transporter